MTRRPPESVFVPAKDGLFAYTVIRSDRKTTAIELRAADGAVLVRVPRRTSLKAAASVVARYADRIAAMRQSLQPTPPTPMTKPLTDAEIAALKTRAAAYLPGRVAYWIAATGLRAPDKLTYTAARGRFGSCRQYPDGRIHLCFSYRLMQFPEEAIDAVVLHEVAHIRHPDHSHAFWRFVRTHMPDYDARHAPLKSLR